VNRAGLDLGTGVKVFDELEGTLGARAMAKTLGYAVVELPIVADFRGASALVVIQAPDMAKVA
jgi:hypothetical protein